MTRRQQDVLRAIREYWETRGLAPTIREICELVGVSSTSTVARHLGALRDLGLVTWEAGCARTIREVP